MSALVRCGEAAAVLLCAFSAGCGTSIRFEARTQVAPDGSVTRTTRYVAGNAASRNEVADRYALPAHGVWKTEPVDGPAGTPQAPVDVYQAETRWPRGCPTTSDHVRRARFSAQAARNAFAITVHDYALVTSFAYEERFSDIVTAAGMERSLRDAYDETIVTIARALAGKRHDGITVEHLRTAIAKALEPRLETFFNTLHRDGVRQFMKHQAEEDDFPLAGGSGDAALVAGAVPRPTGQDAVTWQKVVDDTIRESTSGFDDRLEEEVFGAFGLGLFDSYEFVLEVSLPGTVVESTAPGKDRKTLKWTFDQDAFLGDDYVLRARSRLIHPVRIAAAVAALLVAPIVTWRVVRRR